MARNEERRWIEQVASFALVPTPSITSGPRSRTWSAGWSSAEAPSTTGKAHGHGARRRHVRQLREYQIRLIRALDRMAKTYASSPIDAAQPADLIFKELQRHISTLFRQPRAGRR